jgi:hypothetical protein
VIQPSISLLFIIDYTVVMESFFGSAKRNHRI